MNVKMSRKWMVSLSLTLGLLTLLWAIGSAMAQGPQPEADVQPQDGVCLLYTSPSPRDRS